MFRDSAGEFRIVTACVKSRGRTLTESDPNDRAEPTKAPQTPAPELPENQTEENASEASRRPILIGSQRDPAAYRARRTRDWIPLPESETGETAEGKGPGMTVSGPPVRQETPDQQASSTQPEKPAQPEESAQKEAVAEEAPGLKLTPQEPIQLAQISAVDLPGSTAEPPQHFPPPNIREQLSSDLEEEFNRALGDVSMEELMVGGDSSVGRELFEPESSHTGRVVAVQRDDVFVELGGCEQGCVPVKQFDEPPQPGATLEVVVQRFNLEDGLYDLTLPNRAVEVDDWADLDEGMLVDARITGHNTGGLECEVGHLRGFIPISQVADYRVEDLAQFVDEKFTCLVMEADPRRRNLVLSRRAVLEREKGEARQQLLESLQPGQIHEGVVRKLLDFGAFVDLGGLDGLLHVSQLAWGRVNHPREVLTEGQTIKVKIEKIDHQTGKMSLAYRDLLENPWDQAEANYPEHSEVEGTVSKLMDFGAFVELESGVEGLIHISELSHKRVPRASDVVHEGEKVKVLVLSVDREAQRISLSMKQLAGEPESTEDQAASDAAAPPPKPKKKRRTGPLQGGLGSSSGGDEFGLNW